MGGVQGGWGVENGDKLLKKMKRQCFDRAAPGRFRPTYPGFPVEVGGVEQEHAAFFGRKPHTRTRLVLRSRKSGQHRCEHGAPV